MLNERNIYNSKFENVSEKINIGCCQWMLKIRKDKEKCIVFYLVELKLEWSWLVIN